MSASPFRCPACESGTLRAETDRQVCESCAQTYENTAGITDLRLKREAKPPLPLSDSALAQIVDSLDSGTGYRLALESLLLSISAEMTDRFMLLLGEGRGAWHLLSRVQAGRVLWIGNALSGSWLALALGGFEVLVVDTSPGRIRFAIHRAAALSSNPIEFLLAGDSARLPFADEEFDLVVQEEGLPGPAEVQFGHTLDECLRVTRGEFFITAENRFAYKRSIGRRGKFQLAAPFEWLERSVMPKAGRTSVRGMEKALTRDGFEEPRTHAIYPHMRDYTHVVALDGGSPELPIGPLERKNRIKVLGKALGLFPVFTPSFVTGVARRGLAVGTETRMARTLAALARKLGEPVPEIENWTATRGNCVVVITRTDSEGEAGQWSVHIPMSEHQRRELTAHDENLRFLHENFPKFPTPEPLFCGELEGLWFTCERRIGGIAATQVSRDPDCARRILADTAELLAGLVMQDAHPLSDDDLEQLLTPRFDRVGIKADRPETIAHLEEARAFAFKALRGMNVPRVFYHSDIRAKHVRVERDGSVLGYLDVGGSSINDLPYFDLVNLVVHENKRDGEFASTNAWKRLVSRDGLRDHEIQALDDYAKALNLPAEYCRAIEEIYPVLVIAMCERNWDYSRPRWLHEHFGY